MRFFKKYKKWSKLLVPNIPLKILKFKKPKWKKSQSNQLKYKLTTPFVEHFNVKISNYSWERLRYEYKQAFVYNYKYKLRYDYGVLSRSFNKTKNFTNFFLRNFIKFEYRLDILLWKLKFFSSIYEAAQCINNGFILKNDKVVRCGQLCLKHGDIIQINKSLKLKYLFKEYNLFFSFLEVDYYTQTIVITKDFKSLSSQDVLLSLQDYYPVSN